MNIKRLFPDIGVDIPSWFFHGLRAIDKDFYLIKHSFRVLWDDIINEYEGPLDDPRYCINKNHGTINFGFVLTDNTGKPLEDGSFHLWRYCWPHGWAHIIKIEDTHEKYLRLLLKRLYLQAKITDKYGFKAYSRKRRDEEEEEDLIKQKDKDSLFQAFQEENDWLLRKAKENYLSGKIAPTNPTKETIVSYPNQTNRTKTLRPLEDHEGGLVVE